MHKHTVSFYDLSFHNKLFITFLPLVFLFIIITGGACLYFSGNQLQFNTQTLMENAVHQTAILTEDKLYTIYLKTASIVNSPAYHFLVFTHKKDEPVSKEYLQNRNRLHQQFTDISVDSWDLIDSFVLWEKSGSSMVYMRSPSPYVMKDTYDTILVKQQITGESGELFRYVWQNQHEDTLLSTRIPRTVMTLFSISGSSGSSAGAVLAVNIKTELFTDILKNIVSGEGGFAALISADSICRYEERPGAMNLEQQDLDRLLGVEQKGSYITRDRDGNQVMLSFERLPTSGWVIVSGVPLKSIMTGTELMKKMIFILVIVMLLIAAVPVLFVSRWMSRDIAGLAEQIEHYEIGTSSVEFHTKDQKELKHVAGALNQMVATIQAQFQEMIRIETGKRKAELLLLQSQINPHFLYNTLISVKTLIDLQRYQMASNMFQSLIDFYVISLNHGKERMTVQKELETIRNYLRILAVRYNNSFEWLINVEEEVLGCEILTLTLQPLVENAIQHGVKNKTGPGLIDISGCVYEDMVILTVWDNGIGIQTEVLEKLRASLNQKQQPEQKDNVHFGLWNSNQRLKLYFGEEYGIEIDSEYGKYTSVAVKIPMQKRGAEEDEADDRG